MAMKNRNNTAGTDREQGRSTADYYKLNTRAVDDLVGANESNSPRVSKEELDKYRSRRGRVRMPDWLKAAFIKWWFAGSVCFFIFWGLGVYIADQLDMLTVLAIVLGIVTDVLENNIFRYYADPKGDNDRWMMLPQKRLSSFFLNILYAGLLLLFVFMAYNLLNASILGVTGETGTIPVGVGPILFGLFYMGFDMLFLGMKRMFSRIVDDAKRESKTHEQ